MEIITCIHRTAEHFVRIRDAHLGDVPQGAEVTICGSCGLEMNETQIAVAGLAELVGQRNGDMIRLAIKNPGNLCEWCEV